MTQNLCSREPIIGTFNPSVVADLGVVYPRKVVLPAGSILRNVPLHGILVPAVGYLANPCGEISLRSEELGQHHDIAEVGAWLYEISVDVRSRRSAAAEERCPRRVANGILSVCPVELHSLRCEPVDIRSLGCRIVVIRAQRNVQIVDDDEEHVGPFR